MATSKQTRIATATALAMAIAAPAEGMRRIAYYDPPGVLTVCLGHTGPDVVKGKLYSLDECHALFSEDMAKAVSAVEKCVPGLPVKVLAAFADAGFNLGSIIACNTKESTAARYLKAGDYDAACNQLPRWDKARIGGILIPLPGLKKRRALERDVCLTWRQP